jgi:hypothetical protein
MKPYIGYKQGRISSPNFGGIFFKVPQTKMLTLKKKVNKNYKGQVPLSKQKTSTNQADLKKKGYDGGGGPRFP